MNKIKIVNIILDILIILLFGILIFNIFIKKDDSKEPIEEEEINLTDNKTKNLEDEFKVDDFKFYDSEIIYVKNHKSTISVNILNDSDESCYIKGISAVIYNQKKEEVTALYSDVVLIIEPNQSVFYVFESDKDLYESTYSIEYIPIYDVISE